MTNPASTPETLYVYRGDRLTDPALRGATVRAVRRRNGKCVRGRNSNMLVETLDGHKVVVLARQLRKVKTAEDKS